MKIYELETMDSFGEFRHDSYYINKQEAIEAAKCIMLDCDMKKENIYLHTVDVVVIDRAAYNSEEEYNEAINDYESDDNEYCFCKELGGYISSSNYETITF